MLVVANAVRCLQAGGEQGGGIGGEVDRLFPGDTPAAATGPSLSGLCASQLGRSKVQTGWRSVLIRKGPARCGVKLKGIW